MQIVTVKRIISEKFDEFLESIKDEHTRELVARNSIIAGGCIASMLTGEKVNDFDIYFTDKDTTLAVAKYYIDRLNRDSVVENRSRYKVIDGARLNSDVGIDLDSDRVYIYIPSSGIADRSEYEKEEEHYRPVFVSSNAITLGAAVQLIVRFYGEPEALMESFDFAHCKNYWKPNPKKKHGELVLAADAVQSLLTKSLIYTGSAYPVASVIRTRKFIKRGWSINAGQYLKMAYQISELDLSDIKVLRDQLVGVDSAYFNRVASGLARLSEENNSLPIDSDTVIKLVDRIFGDDEVEGDESSE